MQSSTQGSDPVVPATNNPYCERMRQLLDCPGAQWYYEACLYDVGAQPNDEQAHCQTVQTALTECGSLSTTWRENFNCRKYLKKFHNVVIMCYK